MDPTIIINKRVDVICVFKHRVDVQSLCVPYKMRYKGQEVIFSELALRHPTAQGRRMIHVFDMSDGANDYRLEFDAEALVWTLVAIIQGENHGA